MAYFAAAFACWSTYAWRGASWDGYSDRRFWLFLTIALGALGINKQLDLQTDLTDIGRSLAYTLGWYEQHRTIQLVFIISVAIAGVFALTVMCWLSLPLSIGKVLALSGATFLVSFVLIRAASFHHIDMFLSQTALGLRWNWILELSGITLAGIGAVAERRSSASARQSLTARQRR